MKRACQLIIAFCLLTLCCGPVRAQHSGPYLLAGLGGTALMESQSSDALGSFGLKYTPGLQGSAVLGWDFEPGNPAGEGRIELEYSHRSNPLDEVRFAEGTFMGGGDMTANSLLLNFLGVYRDKSPLAPYIGGGIGAAYIKASDLQVSGQPLSNDADIVFAYQLAVGCEYALYNGVSLDLGYRYFSTSSPKFTDVNGHVFKTDYGSHSAILGLKVGF